MGAHYRYRWRTFDQHGEVVLGAETVTFEYCQGTRKWRDEVPYYVLWPYPSYYEHTPLMFWVMLLIGLFGSVMGTWGMIDGETYLHPAIGVPTIIASMGVLAAAWRVSRRQGWTIFSDYTGKSAGWYARSGPDAHLSDHFTQQLKTLVERQSYGGKWHFS